MAEKKKVVAKRKADRKAFVASRGSEKDSESRKRYYVKTRVAELEKAGKTVSPAQRKALREKFDSGNVSRKGFAAPKKRVTAKPVVRRRPEDMNPSKPINRRQEDMGRRSSPKAPAVSRRQEDMARGSSPRATSRRPENMGSAGSKGRSATSNMKGIAGYGRTDSAGRSGFGATKPKASTSRRPEDMARRNPAPRQEDMGRGYAVTPKKPYKRTDLRNMNPGKKYQAVKPIGKPGKKYLMALAKKNLR